MCVSTSREILTKSYALFVTSRQWRVLVRAAYDYLIDVAASRGFKVMSLIKIKKIRTSIESEQITISAESKIYHSYQFSQFSENH